jgi:hypothetical protein
MHQNRQPGTQLRRVARLAPEPLRGRVEGYLQTRLRGDQVDYEELRTLVEDGRRAAQQRPMEPPKRERSRLAQRWREVQAMVGRIKP